MYQRIPFLIVLAPPVICWYVVGQTFQNGGGPIALRRDKSQWSEIFKNKFTVFSRTLDILGWPAFVAKALYGRRVGLFCRQIPPQRRLLCDLEDSLKEFDQNDLGGRALEVVH